MLIKHILGTTEQCSILYPDSLRSGKEHKLCRDTTAQSGVNVMRGFNIRVHIVKSQIEILVGEEPFVIGIGF